jgi:hypothetical protein
MVCSVFKKRIFLKCFFFLKQGVKIDDIWLLAILCNHQLLKAICSIIIKFGNLDKHPYLFYLRDFLLIYCCNIVISKMKTK